MLDLATGDGAVLKRLASVRRDLTLTGVDSASVLPPPPRGLTLKAGVAMETLPWRDGSVDAVTSQFGFEYGEPVAVAVEVGRVLRPGGRLALMTHRLDGRILAHNRPRREGLRWVLDERALLAVARRVTGLLRPGGALPPLVAGAPAEARAAFGDGSAAWELAEAVALTLTRGSGHGPAAVLAGLDELESRARNEVARIDALEAACRTAGDGSPIERVLGAAGLEQLARDDVREADGGVFARWITGTRSSG